MKLHILTLLFSSLAALLLPGASAQSDAFDVYRNYPACDLCGAASASVTKGGVFLPEGTGGILTSRISCDAAEQLAAEGNLSEASCLLLGLRVSEECGCTNAGSPPGSSPSPPSAPSPTRPSGSSPTRPSGSSPTRPSGSPPTRPSGSPPTSPSAPTPIVPSTPVAQPTGNSVTQPVSSPTTELEEPSPVTGMAFVLLDPITGGTISEDDLSAIGSGCAVFLENAISTISEVTCMASIVSSSSDGADGPVEVELIVAATSTESETIASFSESIQDAINDDQDGFIDALQNESPFFDSLTSANSAVTSPVSEPDDGLSSAALGGIIAGGIAGLLLLCALAFSVSKKGNEKTVTPTSEVVDSTPRRLTTMWNPPPNSKQEPIDKIPVASAAAIATAAQGSTDAKVIRTASFLSDDNASLTDQSTADGSAMSSLRPEMQCRVVQAPSGKLGIVIDTTLDGPVIHRVNEGSPLVGQLFPGDLIVAVNNIDTRAMSAQAITSLMARTSTRKRKMTVLSADVSDEPATRSGGVEESKNEELGTAPPPVYTEKAVVEEKAVIEEEAAVEKEAPVEEEAPVAEEPTATKEVADTESEQASVQEEDDIASIPSSFRSDIQPRTVMAPPGKLGIVIDTTDEGPMVNEIKEGSKLVGLLKEGDLIVKVNDVDTRAMSGAAITSLMVRTARQTRSLTVLSKESGN